MNGRHTNYTKVSIVIPAHNEEGNIEPLTEELAKVIALMKYGVEVVLVNDGSTDRTEQKMVDAMRRYRWVRIVKNRVRLGLTTALTRGFAQARGDILVFYPADLQFHPRDIPKMVEAIDNGADMVCGKKQGQYGKWLVSWIYNIMTRMLFPKLKVSDMNSVKAFTREVYSEFPTMREGWHRYLAAFAATKDYVVREVPVTLQKRHSGKSKFAGKSRILKGLTDLIAVKFQVSVFGDPMHLFGRAALWFFFIGVLIAGVAFYLRFVEHNGYRPLLYAVILFELAALVTFVMGIITEALVYLRDSLSEMKTQNQRLLDELSRRSGIRGSLQHDESENRY
ncbi:MAG: glycosyltransferase, partial [Candidatus Zixiibacteriota bacterium]